MQPQLRLNHFHPAGKRNGQQNSVLIIVAWQRKVLRPCLLLHAKGSRLEKYCSTLLLFKTNALVTAGKV